MLLPHLRFFAGEVAHFTDIVRSTQGNVGGHLLHLVELDIGDEFGIGFGHAVHKLATTDCRFESENDVCAFRLGNSHEFSDTFLGDIGGVDEKVVFGAELGGV